MAIKELLKEELVNSLRMEQDYLEAISKLPKGSLVAKKIRGHVYHYLVFREKGKVKFVYKGKPIQSEIKKYRDAKLYRAKYRRLLSQVRKQILFLRKAIRAKSAV